MSFWYSELGEITGLENDSFQKSYTIIPDGTLALAKILKFSNDKSFKGDDMLSIKWELTDGEFKGNEIKQTILVFHKTPFVKHRALNMLKLLYRLHNLPLPQNNPSDHDLSLFTNRVSGLKISENHYNGKTSNIVSEVHAPQGFICKTGIKLDPPINVNAKSMVDSQYSEYEQSQSNIPF